MASRFIDSPSVTRSGAELLEPPSGRAWRTTLVACLGVLISYLPITATSSALPTLGQALHASTSGLQWVSDLFVIAVAAAVLPAGVLGDVHGRKKVFLAGLALTSVGSVIGLAAPGIHTIWVAEAVMGLGAAALLPSSLALISHAVPDPHERAKHIAAWASSLGLGLALGGISAGVILDHVTWRWMFAPIAGAAFLFMLVAPLVLTDSRAPEGRSLDWYGQGLAVIAQTSLIYAVIEGGSTGWVSVGAIGGFILAAVSLLAFVAVERHVDSPMLDLTLFRSRGFTGAVVVAVIGFFALIGSVFVLSLFYGTVQQLSALEIAWRIAAICGAVVVAGPIAGNLMRVTSPVVLMVAGLLITAGAMLWCTSLDVTTGLGPAAERMALLGFGLGTLLTPMTAAAVAAVRSPLAGMAGAGLNALRQTGGALGPAVLGAVLTAKATSALPGALARRGVTGSGRAEVLDRVRELGFSGATAQRYGAHTSVVQSAFASSFTHALHICTLVAGTTLVAAAAAVLLIEHGPRLLARRGAPDGPALREAGNEMLPQP